MSQWLKDGEVLVGQGSGEVSPRPRSITAGNPRPRRSHGWLASPTTREATPGSPESEIMDKARELFVLCDKDGKGFITKRDMQALQAELPLSPEQLDTVFESLDRKSNGFLTPAEFNTGLGELTGLGQTIEHSQDEGDNNGHVDWTQDPAAVRFLNMVTELGADKIFKEQWELCSLWSELQKDRPELLSVLEDILAHAVSHLQDSFRERDSLEQALRRRESEHDQVVRSMYEEMENQLREEREKQISQDSIRQRDRGQHLLEELKIREQELENALTKQKELESRIRQLSSEQANVREQNQKLRSLNVQLQEQVDGSREQLQDALSQLSVLQLDAAHEQMAKQRNVMKVSKNMQKEKDSLFRQLELLRDMNKRLRDEKDAHQGQKPTPNGRKTLQKNGSIIGNYFLLDEPVKRPQSSSSELEQDVEKCRTDSNSGGQQLMQATSPGRSILSAFVVTLSPMITITDSVKEKVCEGAVLMLPGSKLDLADSHRREATTREGQTLAAEYQAEFYEVSAKAECNVGELMTHLAGMLAAQHYQHCEGTLLLTEDAMSRDCCS